MIASNGPVIRLENVTRWYGNVVAVNDISYDFQPGISGILGPNGAGKSTLLHLMAGFLQPSSGQVLVFDDPPWAHPDLFKRLGLVPESEAVYPFLTARQFATISARLHCLPDPEAAARMALQRVELEDAQDRPMRGYSKGMRQRAKIAASLVHDPEVLLLDEPFNGTDPRLRLHLMELLRRLAAEGRTIIFSSHILEEVERLADEVLVILDGRLAAAGDFHQIRRLMTRPAPRLNRPQQRRPAVGLAALPGAVRRRCHHRRRRPRGPHHRLQRFCRLDRRADPAERCHAARTAAL